MPGGVQAVARRRFQSAMADIYLTISAWVGFGDDGRGGRGAETPNPAQWHAQVQTVRERVCQKTHASATGRLQRLSLCSSELKRRISWPDRSGSLLSPVRADNLPSVPESGLLINSNFSGSLPRSQPRSDTLRAVPESDVVTDVPAGEVNGGFSPIEARQQMPVCGTTAAYSSDDATSTTANVPGPRSGPCRDDLPGALLVPQFHEMSQADLLTLLTSLLMRCNIRRTAQSCCALHGAMVSLHQCCEQMSALRCNGLITFEKVVGQCTSCRALLLTTDCDGDSIICMYCGEIVTGVAPRTPEPSESVSL